VRTGAEAWYDDIWPRGSAEHGDVRKLRSVSVPTPGASAKLLRMTATVIHTDIRGQSFARYFVLALALFFCGLLCAAAGRSAPALKWLAAGLLIVAGCVPLLVQLWTGFAFDRTWVARYGRSTEPIRYWAAILLGVLVVAFWAYGAIRMARA
jgi:hypothetical protein